MLEVALAALANLFQPVVMLYLLIGVAVGTVVGILPALGGLTGMALLLPFIYGMDPTAGVALLVGMFAVTATADTFSSVLLGVPGASSSQATVLDGYPMSRAGRGAEALGAGLFGSMLGGLFGALILFFAIFLARPIVIAIGSPQLFMLALLGLSVVGVLSRGAARLGLLSAAAGLVLGAIGAAPTAPVYRFNFDQLYLFDGIPLAVLALGLFAIPEVVDLLVEKRSVVDSGKSTGSVWAGVRSTIRNPGVVMRSSAIGTFIGALPGLGGTVAHWMAYGVAARTSPNSNFGNGDVRGVIAAESANNSSEGGALIPTLMFGIPGSGSMAMLLGGLSLLGIASGPSMVTTELPLSLSIVWMLALANVLACAVCLVLAKQIARITTIPASVFTPFLFVILFLAAYQSSRHWGDIIAMLTLGGLGWAMKRVGVPRPPLLIGFVLSEPLERYLWVSMGTHGITWLYDPIVIGIIVIMVAFVLFGLKKGEQGGHAPGV